MEDAAGEPLARTPPAQLNWGRTLSETSRLFALADRGGFEDWRSWAAMASRSCHRMAWCGLAPALLSSLLCP